MFNLGFLEIVTIGAIALIVIGPKQLPALARSLGHMIREFKKATSDLSGGLLEIKDEFQRPIKESAQAMQEAEESFEASMSHDEAPADAHETAESNTETDKALTPDKKDESETKR